LPFPWFCLESTGGHTKRQREEADKYNKACPACADLKTEQKQKRSYASSDKELIKVKWEPIREPEETKYK